MEKSEMSHPAVTRGRTWHRRLSTLIRKHPRETPLAPSPPRASSAPPSRIAESTRVSTPRRRRTTAITTTAVSPTTASTVTRTATATSDSTASTVQQEYMPYAADWSTPTPSTDYYEDTETSTTATSVDAPVEVMRVLEHAFRPVEQRPLMVDLDEGMEGGLGKVCRLLAEVSQGTGVIGSGLRDTIRGHDTAGFSKLAERDRYFSSERDELGHSPSVQQVHDVLLAGKECQKQWHNLNGWHLKVHSRLLTAALQPPGLEKSPLACNFMPCATSKITKRYRPQPPSPSPSPPFCLYVDPPSIPDPAASTRIDAIRRFLPHCMMNHLDYAPLRRRPLTVSFATTDPGRGEGLAEANLRMASWHAAQWNFLAEVGRDREGFGDGVGFLPGIIVQGHEWSFVASTREGNKTVLWTKQYIGSTNSILGIYQIATAIQYLAKWSVEVFWPWYRRAVLEFPPDDDC